MKRLGHKVTGSDDNIFDPSRNNLEKAGILPKKWVGLKKRLITKSIS